MYPEHTEIHQMACIIVLVVAILPVVLVHWAQACGCYRSVRGFKGVLRECDGGVAGLLRGCYKCFTGGYWGVMGVLLGCYMGVTCNFTWVVWGRYMSVMIVHDSCFYPKQVVSMNLCK